MSLRIYGIIGLVFLVAGAVAYIGYLRGNLLETQASLAHMEARVHGYEEASRIMTRYSSLLQEERKRWQDIAAELETLDGINDPLNPYLRAVFERVRSAS